MKYQWIIVLAFLGTLSATGNRQASAESANLQRLELGSPFVDNAILQRQMAVPVWGWSQSGTKVSVKFAGQTKSGTADKHGKWTIQLDPLNASRESRELQVTAGDEAVTISGVLVGEVWFSSGQSNMDWLASKSNCRDLANQLARSPEDIPIREYNVDIGSSLYPQSRAASQDGWTLSKQAGSFSALSLAFAGELYEALDVPIGIVRSTHGATPVETWTAYEGFADHPKLQGIALRVRQSNPATSDGKQAYAQYFQDLKTWQVESAKLIDRGGSALPRPQLPGIAEDWKGATRMYNKKIAPLVPYAIRGAIWCQGESNSSDGRVYAAKMEALVNGWRSNWGRPEMPFYFTQLQCYGEPDPNNVGFADLREAQTLFFLNSKHVGMVAQHDLNPARPTGIHPFNKLDPGKRLARWALAHEYDRKIAFTGPKYKTHTIKGDVVRVQFEQRGAGGGLMIGSKGLESEARKNPDAFVEPARETGGDSLKHFRLAGKDKIWHDAEAVIEGDEVIVRSRAVPEPVGVQYAYNNSPIGANLYNRAGLPALPESGRDGSHLGREPAGELVADLLQPLSEKLPGEVDVGALLEDDRHLREPVARERPGVVELREASHGRLDGVGDPLLDLDGGVAWCLSVDLDLDVRDVRDGVDGEPREVVRADGGSEEREGEDHPPSPDGELEEFLDHGCVA